MLNYLRWMFLLWFSLMLSRFALATESLSYQSYSDGSLRMTLVTPSTKGQVFLKHEDKVTQLNGGVIEGLFTLRVKVACEYLTKKSELYWSLPEKAPLKSDVPAQSCPLATSKKELQPVRIFFRQGKCVVDTAGNTLWRTASELKKNNSGTVYQNIYALFVTNKMGFAKEDIHKMRARILYCPDPSLFKYIEADHAKRLFAESLPSERE